MENKETRTVKAFRTGLKPLCDFSPFALGAEEAANSGNWLRAFHTSGVEIPLNRTSSLTAKSPNLNPTPGERLLRWPVVQRSERSRGVVGWNNTEVRSVHEALI